MRKSGIIVFALFWAASSFLFGEGRLKVAVLDATLGSGVEVNASAIVADTINEQFVKSDDYIAIDRAYISKIQAEKKFQLSGEVNSNDVKELGALFGAQFICVANVSKLGSTYTVSARMINVETAQVVSQESAKQKGEIDVLFDLAQEVGDKLVGKNYTPANSPAPASEPVKADQKEKTQAAPAKPVKEKAKPKSRITVGYMFPGYMGNDNNPAIYDLADSWGAGYTGISNSFGIDIESLTAIGSFYASGGLSYTDQNIEITDNYYGTTSEWDNFYTINFYIGGGGIFSVGRNFQVFGGVTLGYFLLTLGSDYGGDAPDSLWGTLADESAGGFSYGIELGADYFLGGFCLSIKYQISYSDSLSGDKIFTDTAVSTNNYDPSFGTSGLVLSAGFSW